AAARVRRAGRLGAGLRKAVPDGRAHAAFRLLRRRRSRVGARADRAGRRIAPNRTLGSRRAGLHRRAALPHESLHDPVRRQRADLCGPGPRGFRDRAQAHHRGWSRLAFRRRALTGFGMSLVLAILLAAQAGHGTLRCAVAVAIARDHLERALQIAPPDEDAAFETERGAPALEHASSPAHPLDKELAAEMGLSAPEPVVTPAREPQRSLPAQAQRELDLARALAASVPPGDAAEGE